MHQFPAPITTARPLPTPARVRRAVLIGSFPPRRCGIATFTSDVRDALVAARPGLDCRIVALTDPGGAYAYDEDVLFEVRQDRLADYLEAARRIDAFGADIVCLQHEFGLFGGPAGGHLTTLLDALKAPVATTVHTVLAEPDDDQRRVFGQLLARSSRVIVMAERGRRILTEVWRAPASRIVVTPHGAPDHPLVETAGPKAGLGLGGREVLLTFGLLSPGKGLETVIRALPAIVAARPEALYVVLGATHPRLAAREGETYREGLRALAQDLGVAGHVRFVNAYVDRPRLLEWLAAADIYVTPYLNESQITSGTLSYAVALGKPVISTPYWHAQELLDGGRGVLTPFNDPAALAEAAVALLTDPGRMQAMRRKAWEKGRETLWSRLAERYLEVFDAAKGAEPRPRPVEPRSFAPPHGPPPALGGVRRLTDDVGIHQHSRFAVPDRNHGYCVDDNARALILMRRLRALGWPAAEIEPLATTYAAFVDHAWNPEAGRFRNFMGYDRQWLEDVGSDDSVARAWWAVAVTAADPEAGALRDWARDMARKVSPHLDGFTALRTYAFLVLGLSALVTDEPRLGHERDLLERLSEGLAGVLDGRQTGRWLWFEDVLTYDNARLPEALLRAGRVLRNDRLVEAGLRALDWLCERQTGAGGVFRPVGTGNFHTPLSVAEPFDQQPLEAAATVDACVAAFAATGEGRWLAEARRAFDWFAGRNDLGVPLADPASGECYDGLTPIGPNLNQGAESVLAFQMAACAMLTLDSIARPGPRPAEAPSQRRLAERCPSSTTAVSDSSPTPRASSFGPSTSLRIRDR
ncbi:MAG: glycosyltransferase [Pseudomonadota bacterium]